MNNSIKFAVLCIFALVILMPCLAEEPPLPHGWRTPTSAETKDEWRNEDADRYLIVRADFNGDGVMDQARMLLRDLGTGLGLFAFVSQKYGTFKTYLLDEKENAAYIEVMGINTVPPGLYKTACGKGYFDCSEGETPEILLRHPAIDYFKEGSANSYFYWDEATEAFKIVGIGD